MATITDLCSIADGGLVAQTTDAKTKDYYSFYHAGCAAQKCAINPSPSCQLDLKKTLESNNFCKFVFCRVIANKIFPSYEVVYFPGEDKSNPKVLTSSEYTMTLSGDSLQIFLNIIPLAPKWQLEFRSTNATTYPIVSSTFTSIYRSYPLQCSYPPMTPSLLFTPAVGVPTVIAATVVNTVGIIQPIVSILLAGSASKGLFMLRAISNLSYLPLLYGPPMYLIQAIFKALFGFSPLIGFIQTAIMEGSMESICGASETLLLSETYTCNFLRNYGASGLIILCWLAISGTLTLIFKLCAKPALSTPSNSSPDPDFSISPLPRPVSRLEYLLSLKFSLSLMASLALQHAVYICCQLFFGGVRTLSDSYAYVLTVVYALLHIWIEMIVVGEGWAVKAVVDEKYQSTLETKSTAAPSTANISAMSADPTSKQSSKAVRKPTSSKGKKQQNEDLLKTIYTETVEERNLRRYLLCLAIEGEKIPPRLFHRPLAGLRCLLIPLLVASMADSGIIQNIIVMGLEIVWLGLICWWRPKNSLIENIGDIALQFLLVLYNLIKMIATMTSDEMTRQTTIASVLAITLLGYLALALIFGIIIFVMDIIQSLTTKKKQTKKPASTRQAVQPVPPVPDQTTLPKEAPSTNYPAQPQQPNSYSMGDVSYNGQMDNPQGGYGQPSSNNISIYSQNSPAVVQDNDNSVNDQSMSSLVRPSHHSRINQ